MRDLHATPTPLWPVRLKNGHVQQETAVFFQPQSFTDSYRRTTLQRPDALYTFRRRSCSRYPTLKFHPQTAAYQAIHNKTGSSESRHLFCHRIVPHMRDIPHQFQRLEPTIGHSVFRSRNIAENSQTSWLQNTTHLSQTSLKAFPMMGTKPA